LNVTDDDQLVNDPLTPEKTTTSSRCTPPHAWFNVSGPEPLPVTFECPSNPIAIS